MEYDQSTPYAFNASGTDSRDSKVDGCSLKQAGFNSDEWMIQIFLQLVLPEQQIPL